MKNSLKEIKRLIKVKNKLSRLKKGNIPVPIRNLTDKFFQNRNCIHIKGGEYSVWPIRKNSIVYSGGLSTNINFELGIINKFDCQVYAFDPTKKSKDFLKNIKNKNLKYHELGVSSESGTFKLDDGKIYECISLVEFAKEKKHKIIDLIKLDIEGYEYESINKILESDLFVVQIILELHGWMKDFSKKNDKILKKRLKKAGYELVYKNLDNYTFVKKQIKNQFLRNK